MSLKEFTKKVFDHYGLDDDAIKIYLAFLRIPRATISEIHAILSKNQEYEYDKIEEITNTLVKNNFLKKVEGIVDRYIPLEPFFELFVNESENLRKSLVMLKDSALIDKSNRFKIFEGIQKKNIEEVENAISSQVKEF